MKLKNNVLNKLALVIEQRGDLEYLGVLNSQRIEKGTFRGKRTNKGKGEIFYAFSSSEIATHINSIMQSFGSMTTKDHTQVKFITDNIVLESLPDVPPERRMNEKGEFSGDDKKLYFIAGEDPSDMRRRVVADLAKKKVAVTISHSSPKKPHYAAFKPKNQKDIEKAIAFFNAFNDVKAWAATETFLIDDKVAGEEPAAGKKKTKKSAKKGTKKSSVPKKGKAKNAEGKRKYKTRKGAGKTTTPVALSADLMTVLSGEVIKKLISVGVTLLPPGATATYTGVGMKLQLGAEAFDHLSVDEAVKLVSK